MRTYLLIVYLFSCACLLFACSGGGGGNTGVTTGSSLQKVTVAGKVAASILYPGTVKIFGVNADGTLKNPALGEGNTERDGSYSISIGGYQGAVVGIAFGRYTDEATKTVIDIAEDQSLYAAVPASEVIGRTAVSFNITPLNDLAYRKARATSDFVNNIALSNEAISQLFGVDITLTAPVPFDALTLSSATTTSEQVKLATLLATLSQLAASTSSNPLAPTAADMQSALAKLAAGITVTGGSAQLSPVASGLLQQAGSALVTNNNTLPVVAAGGNAAQTILTSIATIGSTNGTKVAIFRLRTTGSYSGSLYGIAAKVVIPAGFELRTAANGSTQPGVVVASGQAVNSSTEGYLSRSTLTVGIANGTISGFGIGEFATVYGDIPATVTPPLPSAFAPLTVVKVVDATGNVIPGIGIEVF